MSEYRNLSEEQARREVSLYLQESPSGVTVEQIIKALNLEPRFGIDIIKKMVREPREET